MRNYQDLRVWQSAHDLTLAVYRNTHCFPAEEKFRIYEPNSKILLVHASELGRRVW